MDKKGHWLEFEDIEIICKKCKHPMKLESSFNTNNDIFVCPICKGHMKLISTGSEGVSP